MNNRLLRGVRYALTIAVLTICGATFAEDLDQAKRDGLVGERADGYLGLVDESAPAAIVALVEDVNARREKEYARIAEANELSMDQVRALAGKKTVEKTRDGDWIFVNGGWTRK